MSVTLREKKNADGSISLRLDIYQNNNRTIETLKNLKLSPGSSVRDREQNKEIRRQAEAIRVFRAAELEANNYNMVTDAGKKTIVVDWMKVYVDRYTKKDKRNMIGVLNKFNDFLIEENKKGLTFGNLEALLIEDFIDYLEAKSIGEGAKSYYSRFKKMIKSAYRNKLMRENILDFVEKKPTGMSSKKDILTMVEIQALSSTPIESAEVRRAFLFSCFTGLAWVDVKSLTWQKIRLDSENPHIEIVRQKLKKQNVSLTIPLNKTAISLLGEISQDMSKAVFSLPSPNGANKTLKAWVKRAKINKVITWHNARHSFGTNQILLTKDVVTTSKLLGHSTLKQTNRYVDTAEELKRENINKMNIEL